MNGMTGDKMAVQREQYDAGQLSLTGALSQVFETLIRRADGTWVFTLKVNGEALLPDGRRIPLNRVMPAKANQQIGRRRSN
jgi:hypothetical protein